MTRIRVQIYFQIMKTLVLWPKLKTSTVYPFMGRFTEEHWVQEERAVVKNILSGAWKPKTLLHPQDNVQAMRQ